MAEGIDWGRRQQAAREEWVTVRGHEYLVRLPDHIDIRRIQRSGEDIDEALVLRYVIGWRGITEAHLAPGVGGEDPAPFSPFAWREWIGRDEDAFAEIVQLMVDRIKARQEARAAIPGKSATS